MDGQTLRALQEAYRQVCDLEEGKKEFPHKKVDRQVYDAMDSGETAGDSGNRAKEKRDYDRADKMRSVAAKFGGKSRVREETDLFDAILEHLVAEGYADTNEAALAIMANMSEEWRDSIVNEVITEGEKPFPYEKVTAQQKKHTAAGRYGNMMKMGLAKRRAKEAEKTGGSQQDAGKGWYHGK
jgi:hypothetical protein